MIKKISIIVLVFSFTFLPAQKSINNYQYVVVPIQFEFLKEQDQYRTSSLTKHLFNQLGINAYFDVQELPIELFENRCKALYADVKKVSGGFLKTNIQIELKDCMGNIIQSSQIGSTREKSFKEAYNIAIRKAFESFDYVGYSYEPLEEENAIITLKSETNLEKEAAAKAELESLKQEIAELKQVKKEVIKPEPKIETLKELDNNEQVTTPTSVISNLLYAQKIEGGFQLVDAEPKKVMVLLNTAAENVYTVKGKDAIVFKKDGQWIYSENTGATKTEKLLNIKF